MWRQQLDTVGWELDEEEEGEDEMEEGEEEGRIDIKGPF